jgi:hypothetical protein
MATPDAGTPQGTGNDNRPLLYIQDEDTLIFYVEFGRTLERSKVLLETACDLKEAKEAGLALQSEIDREKGLIEEQEVSIMILQQHQLQLHCVHNTHTI